jgi:hypothetical protein
VKIPAVCRATKALPVFLFKMMLLSLSRAVDLLEITVLGASWERGFFAA